MGLWWFPSLCYLREPDLRGCATDNRGRHDIKISTPLFPPTSILASFAGGTGRDGHGPGGGGGRPVAPPRRRPFAVAVAFLVGYRWPSASPRLSRPRASASSARTARWGKTSTSAPAAPTTPIWRRRRRRGRQNRANGADWVAPALPREYEGVHTLRPCLDNDKEVKPLLSTEHGERFERHCLAKEKALSCLLPAPKWCGLPMCLTQDWLMTRRAELDYQGQR
ncbi:hypothetical protein BDA96_10G054500 [Sorghum bicolor]|uniref:Uncharacterized protein n=1 Tax=Sorghum bicolor TaxID=4558 RepID=A0A921Q214_SORBI|nr:hypothetical protein BDA96_10G054500 [Sorghum bicolor]